jgi:gamma-glutamylputrescine oxidase
MLTVLINLLIMRSLKVHVVEANKVGWGASGRNGGQMIGGISGDGKMASALGVEGERILYGRPRHDVL